MVTVCQMRQINMKRKNNTIIQIIYITMVSIL